MSETEMRSQVLYLKDGKETLTEVESNTEATKRAKRMDEDGYQVLAIMDAKSAEAYLNRHKGIDPKELRENAQDYLRRNFSSDEDVDSVVSDALDEPAEAPLDQDVCAIGKSPETIAYERHHRRCTALDFALRMYGGEDSRNSSELVDDAQTILNFLEG